MVILDILNVNFFNGFSHCALGQFGLVIAMSMYIYIYVPFLCQLSKVIMSKVFRCEIRLDINNWPQRSVILHVNPKNPFSVEKLKITSTKIQIFLRNFFPEWFGHKEIEHIRFWKSYMKNQLKLIFPKECGIWSRKGSNILSLL